MASTEEVKTVKTYCFDIDGVLIDRPSNSRFPWDYEAKPINDNIAIVKKLYDEGNYIKLYTARGSCTKIDWTEKTNKELQSYGIPFHELHFGKPDADYYVDDRFIPIKEI